MSTLAKKLNASLSLTGKLAVLTGGSQGIGAGAAVRFAEAGSSVIVVGRNQALLQKTIDQCKQAAGADASSKTFDYVTADLSAPSGMKQAARDISDKAKGSVNYLVQTQGGPPNGRWEEHHGMDSHFAVQVLSRYAMSELLASSGVLKDASVNICAPGGSQTEFDLEDFDCRSYKNSNALSLMMAIGKSQGLLTDTYTQALQAKYPSISFYHLFPGVVTTNSASNRGFPFPLPQLFSLFAPIISRTVGNSPQSYADIPVLLAANSGAEKQDLVQREGRFMGPSLKSVNLAPWSRDPQNQERTIRKLQDLLDASG